jgi:hypothetical protein
MVICRGRKTCGKLLTHGLTSGPLACIIYAENPGFHKKVNPKAARPSFERKENCHDL